MIESHLGGHMNRTHCDVGALECVINYDNTIVRMLDIGCGPGGMSEIAEKNGLSWVGIDGDVDVIAGKNNTIVHDFRWPYIWETIDYEPDLIWSVEFLEHIDEEYLHNVMKVISRAKYALVTAAPPGYPGHHHVNCRAQEYWIGVFSGYGLKFNSIMTQNVRMKSTMHKPFMQATGMFFNNMKVKCHD